MMKKYLMIDQESPSAPIVIYINIEPYIFRQIGIDLIAI